MRLDLQMRHSCAAVALSFSAAHRKTSLSISSGNARGSKCVMSLCTDRLLLLRTANAALVQRRIDEEPQVRGGDEPLSGYRNPHSDALYGDYGDSELYSHMTVFVLWS